jgi:hypothetical protein
MTMKHPRKSSRNWDGSQSIEGSTDAQATWLRRKVSDWTETQPAVGHADEQIEGIHS